MISVEKALEIVLSVQQNYGVATVPLLEAGNRFLATPVFADRDAPPFNRVMMDGIAVHSNGVGVLQNGVYKIAAIQAAGDAQKALADASNCIEVMTGAILPGGTDSVIPYEMLDINEGTAVLKDTIAAKINIHYQGSDHKKGVQALSVGRQINAAATGLLASIGINNVPVFKMPSVAIVATGNELVAVDAVPERHQVRMSNVYSLYAALKEDNILPKIFHITDDQESLLQQLGSITSTFDVVLISGGVSKGKYDFVPVVLEKLGVQKLFHQVAQRPGKPFWFGHHPQQKTVVFALPGNPISTFVCYHYYFRKWLYAGMGSTFTMHQITLAEAITPHKVLSQFIPVVFNEDGKGASAKINNGSGDLFSLAAIDGFIYLPKGEGPHPAKSFFPFLPIK